MSKLAWTVAPFSMVTFWKRAAERPSITAPWTWFMAPDGLTIWEPTSAATQTLSTLTAPSLATVACTTSAK